MRIGVLTAAIVLVGFLGGRAWAQPKDGDLVFTASRRSSSLFSYVAHLDPNRGSAFTTLAVAPSGSLEYSAIRMAPDNTNLTVGYGCPTIYTTVVLPWNLMNLTPAGTMTPVCHIGLPGTPVDLELDHDGSWVVTMNARINFHKMCLLGGVDARHGGVVGYSMIFGSQMDQLAIGREPGAGVYLVHRKYRGLFVMDRQSNVTSIPYPGPAVGFLEFHPRSGDYLTVTACRSGPSACLCRIGNSGALTTVQPLPQINEAATSARIMPDDTAWISFDSGFYRCDLATGAVVTFVNVPALKSMVKHVEVYGSRRLLCQQSYYQSPEVAIYVQSRNPLAAGASYALAASPARRPGIKFANGEWLHLDVTHPLFLLTAQNLAPKMFVNFRGALDQNGDSASPIQVNFPPGLPRLGGMTIFVAGVIHRGGQVIQVTNTHWFVLD